MIGEKRESPPDDVGDEASQEPKRPRLDPIQPTSDHETTTTTTLTPPSAECPVTDNSEESESMETTSIIDSPIIQPIAEIVQNGDVLTPIRSECVSLTPNNNVTTTITAASANGHNTPLCEKENNVLETDGTPRRQVNPRPPSPASD